MDATIEPPPIAGIPGIGTVGYIGPEGTWTHQAALDLFRGGVTLLPFAEGLFAAYAAGAVDAICVPVTTSLVGATPYLDDVLALGDVTIIAEYPKVLSYSLIAGREATFASIRTVMGHAVALEEVGAWIDANMPDVEREIRAGATAYVAEQNSPLLAAFGPGLGARLFDLKELRTGIEEGLHNVTRWWVLGRATPAPTGNDRTTLHLRVDEGALHAILAVLVGEGLTLLNIYERPTGERLDAHQYVIDVEGHVVSNPAIARLASVEGLRVLGSYPRRY